MPDEIGGQILRELTSIRRTNQRMAWLCLLVVIAGVVFVAFVEHRYKRTTQGNNPVRPWNAVNAAYYRLDYPKALSLAQAVVAHDTNNCYGYSYLGNIYLAMGDLPNAEAEYLRAYELFPDEQNENNLTAVRKRLASVGHAEPQPK
jgi:tetratricopeptide (TPR) repeat protein